MRILHTSDWHLGHALYRRERDAEHAAFLAWLAAELAAAPVDALVVAGDVFDVAQPGLLARTQYHDFLARVAARRLARCAVVIAGNHDSAGLLDVSRSVLSALQVHVFGASVEPERAVVAVPGETPDASPAGYIAAVPFLRGADFHGLAEARLGGDIDAAIRASVAQAYEAVLAAARARAAGRPVVATGHLHADGSLAVDDSVRDIQIGRQAAVPLEVFGDGFDYVALGHLHREGRVFGQEHIRYCGAPLPMSFAEAGGPKYVLRAEVRAGAPAAVERVEVPVFRRILRLAGPLEAVRAQLNAVRDAAAADALPAWAEIVVPAGVWSPGVRDELQAMGRLCGVDVLMVRAAERDRSAAAGLAERADALEDLTPEEVFEALLAEAQVDAADAGVLGGLFAEILRDVRADEGRR